MTASPAERRLAGLQAAYGRWAKAAERTAAMEAAGDGLLRRFERQVDPDGVLPPQEREKLAQAAQRAHMASLARKSATARRLRKEGQQLGPSGS